MSAYLIAGVIIVAGILAAVYYEMVKEQKKMAEKNPPGSKSPVIPQLPHDAYRDPVPLAEDISLPAAADIAADAEEEDEFGGPLEVRPDSNAEGWEVFQGHFPIHQYKVYRWRDPADAKIKWVDYRPQLPETMDGYYIASGALDVTAPVWNMLWITAEGINSNQKPEGLDRLRMYDKGLRSDPRLWPEPFKSVYLESHPQDV